MRSRLVVLVAAVVVVAGAVTTTVIARSSDGHADAKPSGKSVSYAEVRRADVAMTLSLSGTLGFGVERPVKGGAGRVTWLPAAGAVVARGQPLFRRDDRPVALLYGDTPLFRPLDRVGLVGRDVRVVADNLHALGYNPGSQPAVGSVVPQPSASPTGVKIRAGDAVFTSSVVTALKRWQTALGLPVTGALDPADVIVLADAVRVATVTAQLGDDATAPVLSVTSTSKVVSVRVQPTEADAVRSAEQVIVTLPDGTTTAGKVTGVGRTATAPAGQDQDSGAQLTATVALDDPARVEALDSAPVQVSFAAQTHAGVLVVPVGALLALAEGGYAVQTDGDQLIAVTTGLFDRGLVEVSGTGLREGLRVVTTS
jgi:peptidoglycan hydrolase-like protein with peptidoglycan-binding domain